MAVGQDVVASHRQSGSQIYLSTYHRHTRLHISAYSSKYYLQRQMQMGGTRFPTAPCVFFDIVHIDVHIKEIGPEQTIPLRHAVLWPDHPISHVVIPEDDAGQHFGAFVHSRDEPVAVISVFREPVPGLQDTDAPTRPALRFRKFACDPAHQGRGIGTILLRHIFAIATQLHAYAVWCDARASTAGWYSRRGMTRFGDTFWKGNLEYVRMKADL